MECIYCGEESKYVALIPKPSFFIWEDKKIGTIDGGKPICLNCLQFEMDETREM